MHAMSANPPKIMLLGGIILDRYFEVERYPRPGGDALIQSAYDRVGGCCLNVAITLQNLGAMPYIVTQIGDDVVGRAIESYLVAQKLPSDYVRKAPGRHTGYCLNILERSGERTFFTHKGFEAEFPADTIPPTALQDFAFAYITGYYLLNRETAGQVLQLATALRDAGCRILFDPGALIGEMDPVHLQRILRSADWLVPNSAEWTTIRNTLDLGEDGPARLFEQGLRGVAVKRGTGGVEVLTPDSRSQVASLPVRCVDSTGAGDSFAGGLIYGLSSGSTPQEAAALGSACGAFTCTLAGPHGRFSAADIQHLIETIGKNDK